MHPDPNDSPAHVLLSPEELAFLEDLDRQLTQQDVELRAHERHVLAVEVLLTSLDHAPIQGRTIDVSRGGLRAVVDDLPDVGTHYAVTLMDLQAEPLRSFGRCLRVAILDDGGFEAVLHFVDPLPADGPLG